MFSWPIEKEIKMKFIINSKDLNEFLSGFCKTFPSLKLKILQSSRSLCLLYDRPVNMCYARCPNPRAGREKASKTMQHTKKGKFIADLSQGSCRNQRSGAGSESPEPTLLSKFIGCA